MIIGLLFVITTINYMDRNLLGVLKPTIQGDLHFSETEYGDIVFAFSMAYAAGYASMGAFTDKVGVRIGLAVAAMVWCAASTAHGLVTSVAGFTVARIVLGLGEGGNFPTCIKSVATWFPVRDRALATGIFNSGSNVGGLVAPLVAAFVTARWGWQTAFYVTGLVGFVWVAFWLVMYRAPEAHPRVSAEELAYIRSDPEVPTKHIPWARLLRYPGDLDVYRGRRADQSGVVVLQQLGAELPVLEVPCEPDGAGAAAGGDLPDDRCRLDRRRVAVGAADQAGVRRVHGAEAGVAGVCVLHAAGVPGADG